MTLCPILGCVRGNLVEQKGNGTISLASQIEVSATDLQLPVRIPPAWLSKETMFMEISS